MMNSLGVNIIIDITAALLTTLVAIIFVRKKNYKSEKKTFTAMLIILFATPILSIIFKSIIGSY